MKHRADRALSALTLTTLFALPAALSAQQTHPAAAKGHSASLNDHTTLDQSPVFIDFDHDASGNPLAGAALFNPVTVPALSTMYAALGVTFSGPGGIGANTGGVIVDRAKGFFTVPTRSGKNFLAFLQGNFSASYASGPETLTFSKPIASMTIYAISPGSSLFTIKGYNSAGVLVDSSSVYAPEYDENNFDFSYYPLSVHANALGNITRVTLTQQSVNPPDNIVYEYDDLTFLPASTNPVVSGRIAIESVSDLSATHAPLDPVTFLFRTPGTTTTVQSVSASLTPVGPGSPYGTYQFSVPAGTYDVAIKTSKTLRTVLPDVAVNAATTLPDTLLLNGDCTDDNIVDIGDFGIIVNAYYTFLDDPTSGYDPRADLNYDGIVDISDFGVIVNEFLTPGAP